MAKTKRREKKKSNEGPPLAAVAGAAGGFFLAYLVAEASLNPTAHPLHWLVAGAGAVLGLGLGYLWYRWRGDIA